MKTIDEVREEMGELEPVEWPEIKREPDKKSIAFNNEWYGVNEELKQKIRLHPLEVVFLGVMIALCGFLLIGIIEGIQWLLS